MLAPFRGIRYARDRVSGIANVTSPPYDVINGGILDHLGRRTRTTWSVSSCQAPDAPTAELTGRGRPLRQWLSAGVLIRDRMAALYIYEQRPGGGVLLQRGIIGLVRLGSPESAGILPHENVMPASSPGGGADGGHAGEPGADLPDLRRRSPRRHGHRDHADGHRGHGPGRGRAGAAGGDHHRGRHHPPAVAAGRSRRAGRDRRRPFRPPGADRRRAPPVRGLPAAAGRDARGRPARDHGTTGWRSWSTRPPTRPGWAPSIGCCPACRRTAPPSWPRPRSPCRTCRPAQPG